MAEFTEVCRQAMRLNEAFCTERGRKPITIELLISAAGYVVFKNGGKSGTAEEIERFIMEWAAEHPEPAYPTWEEWQKETFPNFHAPVNPCIFTSCTALECDGDCRKCARKHISAEIAEALGVKLLEATK